MRALVPCALPLLLCAAVECALLAPPGPSVLLTGGTGFVGKVVLEQLLQRRMPCTLLLRPKQGLTAEARLRQLQRAPCFAGLPEHAFDGVRVLSADLAQPDLGLGAGSELEELIDRTTHIIHLAASVEFDLPICRAAASNVDGALSMLRVAKRCRRLEAFVHCSTAYVTPAVKGRPILERPVHVRVGSLEPAELHARIASGELSREQTAEWLEQSGHPNTYTFTKALAEQLLSAERGEVPLRIVRPSIISACLRRPSPGWIDSKAAFASFVCLYGGRAMLSGHAPLGRRTVRAGPARGLQPRGRGLLLPYRTD